MIKRMLSIRRSFVLISTVGCIILISDLTGVHRHLFEKDFKTAFSYPLDISDFPTFVQRYRNHEPISQEPINEVTLNLKYKSKADIGCKSESYRLIILVKSKPENFLQRQAIRVTWGFPKRFSDVNLKTVFLLGNENEAVLQQHEGNSGESKKEKLELKATIENEIAQYKDIILGDFIDSDYNSTVKLTMGLKWLAETCDKFRFALIVSDDMYVSVKNILKFIRHPTEYPEYWEKQKKLDDLRNHKMFHEKILKKRSLRNLYDYQKLNNLESDNDGDSDKIHKQTQTPLKAPKKTTKTWKNSPIDFDIDLAEDVVLYSGNVISGPTHRNKIGTKYYLTLEEYPYNQLPPFASTEAIMLSRSAVMDLYYSSLFVKYLRLDDLYLGICAKKMNIEPFHSKYFMVDSSLLHDPYGKDYRYVLTANNFDDPEILQKFWHGQKKVGNA